MCPHMRFNAFLVDFFVDETCGGVQEFANQAEARVLFHGVLKGNGSETEFNETWHLIREMRDDAPWYIQGIEQNG